MKRYVVPLLLVIGLVCLPALGVAKGAKIAKKGKIDGVYYYAGRYKALSVGKTPRNWNYEVFGIRGRGPKTSPFFHASSHCLGSLVWTDFKKLAWASATTCVYTRPDGDKIIMKYSAVGKGGLAKGKWAIVGGTGKFKGMTGQGTFVRVSARPAARGTFQGYQIEKGTYQLP